MSESSPFAVIDSAEFVRLLESVEGPVVIKVTASFCQPCRMMAPRLDDLASRHPNVTYYQIQADQSPEQMQVVKANGLKTVPTLITLLADGNRKDFTGAMADVQLRDWLNTLSL